MNSQEKARQVGLHWIDLDLPQWALQRHLLSDEECGRVDRMVFAHDRQRCLAGWAARRLLLAPLLGLAPDRLRFRQEPEGRPYLAGRPLEFNLSHSGDVALLAVTSPEDTLLLGVDVENASRPVDCELLSSRFFHPYEVAHLRRQDFSSSAFFRIWTAKESYLKALGTGLRRALDSFNVVDSEGRWRLCEPPGQPLPDWMCQFFAHPQRPDFVACLTANRNFVEIQQHLFEPSGDPRSEEVKSLL